MNRNIMEYIPDGQVSLEKEIFPLLAGKDLYGLTVSGLFIDIGVSADYLQLRDNPNRFTNILKNMDAKKEGYHDSATDV